jgi:hypothetical protein
MKLPQFPYLSSALLGHADPRVTDEDYKRMTSLIAGTVYAELVQEYLNR